jgi:hypothetical protein
MTVTVLEKEGALGGTMGSPTLKLECGIHIDIPQGDE